MRTIERMTKSLMIAILMAPIILFATISNEDEDVPPQYLKCYVISREWNAETAEFIKLHKVAIFSNGYWYEANNFSLLNDVLEWHFISFPFYYDDEQEQYYGVHTDGPTAPTEITDLPDDAELSTEPLCTSTEDTDSPRNVST